MASSEQKTDGNPGNPEDPDKVEKPVVDLDDDEEEDKVKTIAGTFITL